MKKALLIGSTGATGQHLVHHLLNLNSSRELHCFARRKLEINNPRVIQHQVNFDDIGSWAHLLTGDELFMAFGTTQKLAKSKTQQYLVDYTYQAQVIKAASENGVKHLYLVSAPGANAKAFNFYVRIKGELEDFAKSQSFESMVFFQPSVISAHRPEGRPMERVFEKIFSALAQNVSWLSKYRPISADDLALAIAKSTEQNLPPGVHYYEWDQIFKLIRKL